MSHRDRAIPDTFRLANVANICLPSHPRRFLSDRLADIHLGAVSGSSISDLILSLRYSLDPLFASIISPMDTTENCIFLIDVPTIATRRPTELQFGHWNCTLYHAQTDSDLNMIVRIMNQESTDRSQSMLNGLKYTRLRVLSNAAGGQESIVVEMPVRQPEVLVKGLQDPVMVQFHNRYIFRLRLVNDHNRANIRHRQKHHLPKMTIQPSRATPCLGSSQVSMEARQRLTEFLERADNPDIQLTFNESLLPPSYRVSMRGSEGAYLWGTHGRECVIHAHSCILNTAGPQSMKRLLSTFLPAENSRGSYGQETDASRSYVSMELIREVRFEDSPLAVVQAVVRYIYLGQKPVMEPFCGYTVKDLIALATYLEIECLQDHCVDLVLGRSQELDDQPWARCLHPCCPRTHTRASGSKAMPLQSRIPVENVVQVLFDWGYKFSKIRRGLVQALIHDHSYVFSNPGAEVLLGRFRGHESFDGILCELVEGQLDQACTGRAF